MIEQLTFLSYSSEHSHRFSNSDLEGLGMIKYIKGNSREAQMNMVLYLYVRQGQGR